MSYMSPLVPTDFFPQHLVVPLVCVHESSVSLGNHGRLVWSPNETVGSIFWYSLHHQFQCYGQWRLYTLFRTCYFWCWPVHGMEYITVEIANVIMKMYRSVSDTNTGWKSNGSCQTENSPISFWETTANSKLWNS